jgi:2-dehydro-3-deoxyphosphogluconate aldolase/(4S)-4-hydroxy-2-oxoglutarate aldolase
VSSALRGDEAMSSLPARTDALVQRLSQLRILPVATLPTETAEDVGRALVNAGLPCIEITFRAAGAAEAIRRARTIDGLLVGAGTVLTPDQARAAAEAGAAFALAPGLNEEIVDCCRELGLPFFPGVATPTEVDRARRLGLHTLKAFPIATLGGPAFLRAVSATHPDVRFIPTGGVNPTNLQEYLALGNVVACGGSWLVSERILRTRAFDELARLAREAVGATA